MKNVRHDLASVSLQKRMLWDRSDRIIAEESSSAIIHNLFTDTISVSDYTDVNGTFIKV
jgi:hypothetical protein